MVSPNGIVNVIEGNNLTLTCSDPGYSGMPRYVWINSSDGSSLTTVINNPPLVLELNNVSSKSSGNYTCRAFYVHLTTINKETTVTVNVLPLSKL